jgi:hypothetical protein
LPLLLDAAERPHTPLRARGRRELVERRDFRRQFLLPLPALLDLLLLAGAECCILFQDGALSIGKVRLLRQFAQALPFGGEVQRGRWRRGLSGYLIAALPQQSQRRCHLFRGIGAGLLEIADARFQTGDQAVDQRKLIFPQIGDGLGRILGERLTEPHFSRIVSLQDSRVLFAPVGVGIAEFPLAA